MRVAHYPPYCSKHNPIEHQVFPHITRACQGVIFHTVDIAQHFSERPKTTTGLGVKRAKKYFFPQCGNKRLCRLSVTPSISIPGSHMLEVPFCLYAAWLLIEIRHAGYSRLFPHWCKGCYGHVWGVTVRLLDKVYQTGRKYAVDFKHTMKIVFDDSLPKWNYRAVPECT